MRRQRIRLNQRSGIAPAGLLGLTVGLLTGFLAGGFLAGRWPNVLRRVFPDGLAPEERPSADLAAELEDRLEQALGPDGPSLELVPVGRQALEVHGWVTSRAARSRALRIAREAFGPNIRLVDCLLVWGEDDLPSGEHPIALDEDPG